MPTALLVSVCLRARLQACINLNSSSSCLTSNEVSGILRRWTDLSHGRQAGGSKTHHHDDVKDSCCHPPALTAPCRWYPQAAAARISYCDAAESPTEASESWFTCQCTDPRASSSRVLHARSADLDLWSPHDFKPEQVGFLRNCTRLVRSW